MNFRIDYEPKKRKEKKDRGKINIKGKKVCITGALPGMNRTQATNWAINIKRAFYVPVVDRSVEYLIVGKSSQTHPSTKMRTATLFNIPQIKFENIL